MKRKQAPIKNSPRLRFRGFTLMELLMAIAVLAILISLAVPSFSRFVQENRLAGQANEMVAALQFARSEALKRVTWVELCASNDQSSCSGDVGDGWVVRANPASLDNPDKENPLRAWSSPGDNIKFSTIAQNSARFTGSGCFDHDDDGTCSADFSTGNEILFVLEEDPDIEGIQPRQVRVAQTGRVTACREDADDDSQCETN